MRRKPKRPKRIAKAASKDSVTFTCPVCWQRLTIPVDLSAGDRQQFIYDCEVCCRPLRVTIALGIVTSASVESE